MGYLDNSSITVDAVVTKRMRRNMALGQSIDIKYLCLSDTGVNYTLYNEETNDPETEIPEDDITPFNMDEDEEGTEEKRKPTKESLGESLLSKVEGELPAKVAEIKEKE